VSFPNELYDLKADARETTNLYADANPLYSKITKYLSAQLAGFFSKYTVPGNSGLDLEHQPMATSASPWLEAAKMHVTAKK